MKIRVNGKEKYIALKHEKALLSSSLELDVKFSSSFIDAAYSFTSFSKSSESAGIDMKSSLLNESSILFSTKRMRLSIFCCIILLLTECLSTYL